MLIRAIHSGEGNIVRADSLSHGDIVQPIDGSDRIAVASIHRNAHHNSIILISVDGQRCEVDPGDLFVHVTDTSAIEDSKVKYTVVFVSDLDHVEYITVYAEDSKSAEAEVRKRYRSRIYRVIDIFKV